jgi:hypothetical protein
MIDLRTKRLPRLNEKADFESAFLWVASSHPGFGWTPAYAGVAEIQGLPVPCTRTLANVTLEFPPLLNRPRAPIDRATPAFTSGSTPG